MTNYLQKRVNTNMAIFVIQLSHGAGRTFHQEAYFSPKEWGWQEIRFQFSTFRPCNRLYNGQQLNLHSQLRRPSGSIFFHIRRLDGRRCYHRMPRHRRSQRRHGQCIRRPRNKPQHLQQVLRKQDGIVNSRWVVDAHGNQRDPIPSSGSGDGKGTGFLPLLPPNPDFYPTFNFELD